MARTFQVVFAVDNRRDEPIGLDVTDFTNLVLGKGTDLKLIDTLTYKSLNFKIYTCAVRWTFKHSFTVHLRFPDCELRVMANSDDIGYDHVKEHYENADKVYPSRGETISLKAFAFPNTTTIEEYMRVNMDFAHFECMTMFI
jgi:hypothetical protein